MNFCLMPDQINALKPRMKQVGAKALLEMSSKERTAFFSETLGSVAGTQVSVSFEKAMASKQQNALSNWAKSVFTEKEKKSKSYPDLIHKINKIQQEGILKPSLTNQYLDSLIATSLGLELKPEEVKKIDELSEKIQSLEKKVPDNPFFGYHTDYFKARKEMNDYLESISPSNVIEILFGLIGRGNLLTSVKSPTTNIVSNLSSFITEPLVRRMIDKKFSGVNSDLIIPFIKESYAIYKATGYDPVRMLKIQDNQKTLGESRVTTQGEGKLRKVAHFYEDFVFKKLMGAPDILSASAHFADSLNISTSAVADKEGLTGDAHKARARQLFLTATRLDHTGHDIADILRLGAIDNALYATYQQDSWYSKVALAIRNNVDKVTGDIKLGTNLEPFIKTPVNVIGAGIEYSGVTIPITLANMIHNVAKGEPALNREMSRQIVRAGLGLVFASLLAGLLDDDDYIPDYTIASPKQKEITRLSNASYNSIRIGGKWVSLDYFGVLGVAVAGFMGARQKNGADEKALSYAQNAFTQIRRAPIVSTLMDTYNWFEENKKYQKTTTEIRDELIGKSALFFYSRAMPMIVADVAKAMDDKQRYNDYNQWFDDIQAQVPFAREFLPPKYNDFGGIVPTENAFWTIVAGARVKTATDDAVYSEVSRLSNEGVDVNLTASRFKPMLTAKKLLSPREYNELNGQVQLGIRNAYLNVSETQEYKDASTDDKKKMLEATRKGVMESVLDSNGYSNRIYDEIQKEKDLKN